MTLLSLVLWGGASRRGRADRRESRGRRGVYSATSPGASLFTRRDADRIVLLILSRSIAKSTVRTEKDLKMSKMRYKEEMQRMDGDPKIKASAAGDRAFSYGAATQ